MKRITLILAICLSASVSFGQLDFGIKGGLNLTNISADGTAGDFEIKSTPGSQLGYHFGAELKASLFGIFVQPELLFTSVASEYTVTDINTTTEQLAKQRIGRIDVPLIVGVQLGGLHIGLGPVGSIVVSDKSDLKDITGYEAKLNTATIGYQIGGGIDFWKMGFDIRYEGNLSALGDGVDIGGQTVNFDTRARQVLFSLSYRF